MVVRVLVLLSIAASSLIGQADAPIHAGDPAPTVDWSKLVRSPESAKYQPNLAGQYSVLQFLPITPNAQAIQRWNDLAAAFSGKAVQFVWIASEPQSDIEPFLRDHPLSGWVLADPKREITRAFGIETGSDVNVIVDPSGMIAGYTSFLESEQLSGILDGKAVALARPADDDQASRLFAEGKVRLDREPERFSFPPPTSKPDIPPSYEVHISPS